MVPKPFLGRRAALTGISLATAAVVLLVAVPLIAAFSTQRDEVEDALRQLARYRAEVGLKPQLDAELQTLRQRGATGLGLIVADNAQLAEAQLEHEIKAIVESNGGEVRSSQSNAPKPLGNLERISVQYDLALPITRLSAVIYAVEAHTPYYFIDRADISGPTGWQPQTQLQKSTPEPKLELRWTLHAYRWSAK